MERLDQFAGIESGWGSCALARARGFHFFSSNGDLITAFDRRNSDRVADWDVFVVC
jgi:hypothetical protein